MNNVWINYVSPYNIIYRALYYYRNYYMDEKYFMFLKTVVFML